MNSSNRRPVFHVCDKGEHDKFLRYIYSNKITWGNMRLSEGLKNYNPNLTEAVLSPAHYKYGNLWVIFFYTKSKVEFESESSAVDKNKLIYTNSPRHFVSYVRKHFPL